MTAFPSTEDLARLAKENYDDPQYLAALGMMLVTGRAATSLVQRALGIGYIDAVRIVERIEADGIISRPNSAGKREVLDRREAEAWSPATNILPWCALTIDQMRAFESSTGEIQRMGLNGEWIATDTPLSPGLIYRIHPHPPQPSETVAELLEEARSGLCAYTGGPDGACGETVKRIDAALRALKGGEANG